ncbi:hypothetical protein GZH47_30815 [Paenibacillus rhizovicinus]|uniref:Uncharacterized protein n=1 Tax=Paenibacillus rhizovicinus TaxID=2704463 RepID=A0A6C0P845_9BACL|nr:hypothetical protein [Paenibacillus rhizovicinus]QHW34757.1 hypothetical protein GZH47_30815 [Paenibacillus rhizovicinus]
MKDNNHNYPHYFNGYAGNGESLRRIADQLAASMNDATQQPSASALGAIGEANPVFPIYFNGHAGNGASMRRMAENL